MYVVYCNIEPGLIVYLSNDDIKHIICKKYKRLDFRSPYAFSYVIRFNEDIRKACKFVTRDVALQVASFISTLFPDDFKIKKV